MTIWHFVGAALVLLLITGVGVWSGRQVKSASDFSGGSRKAGTGIVAGVITGTMVGGASTIGTAQLAFTHGFSAWWFTLGGGLGCLLLALVYAKPLYDSNAVTLPQIFAAEYGNKVATAATLMTSAGSFVSIVSQLLSGMALVASVCNLGGWWAAAVTALLMLLYVVFGGVWGAGKVGAVKTILLYVGVGSCGVLAINHGGGLMAFSSALPAGQYFNLFARGVPTDLGAGLSLIAGVISTQTYIQAVVSAKSLKIAKLGAVFSALLIPVIGIAGIYVGMYMKINCPDTSAASALPLFIMQKLPPLIAGSILATLLVALIGTGAGLSLGIGSMVCRDIYKSYLQPNADDQLQLRFTRGVIIAVLAAACLMAGGNMGSLIISWSFLSMGLRGAVAFFPLCAALFYKGKIPGSYAFASMIMGPLATLAGKFLIPGIDPLFPGMAAAVLILAAGCIIRPNR